MFHTHTIRHDRRRTSTLLTSSYFDVLWHYSALCWAIRWNLHESAWICMMMHDVSRTCAAVSSPAVSAELSMANWSGSSRMGTSRSSLVHCKICEARWSFKPWWLGDLCDLPMHVVPSGAICCAVTCSTFLSASLRCAKACQYIQIRQVPNCPEQAGVPRIKNITDAIAEQQRGPLILLQTNSTGYTKPMRIQSITVYIGHRRNKIYELVTQL